MDKLSSIKVFQQVARLGNFTIAAETLGISKAMASKHVSQLENQLGVRLLNRTTRHLSLTEAGTTYRERIGGILDEMEEIELAVGKLSSEPRGTLRVMAPPSFGSFHLTRAIADYRKQYRNVSFDLIFTERPPDIVEEGLDMAIYIGALVDSSLIARQLTQSRLMICGSPDYLQEHGIPETPSALSRHNCLILSTRAQMGEWAITENGDVSSVRVTGDIRSHTGDALRIAAIKGCGLIQLPTYLIGADIKTGKLKPVLEQFEPPARPIYAIYLHRRHLSAKIRTFVDFLYERYHSVPYREHWTSE